MLKLSRINLSCNNFIAFPTEAMYSSKLVEVDLSSNKVRTHTYVHMHTYRHAYLHTHIHTYIHLNSLCIRLYVLYVAIYIHNECLHNRFQKYLHFLPCLIS